jgi:hypothetical protein
MARDIAKTDAYVFSRRQRKKDDPGGAVAAT